MVSYTVITFYVTSGPSPGPISVQAAEGRAGPSLYGLGLMGYIFFFGGGVVSCFNTCISLVPSNSLVRDLLVSFPLLV